MKKERKGIKIVNTIWVTACGIVFLLPLLWMLSASVKTGPEVFSENFKWIPDEIQWGNYIKVWVDGDVPFWRAMCNSLFVSILSTAGRVIVSSMAGYALAKIQFRGRHIIFVMMMITMMIPGQAVIIPRFVLFKEIGLYDTLWSLIFPDMFSITAIFLLRQFYLGLPNELMDSAKVDGASYMTIWSQILMPLTKPAMVTVIVLAFISSWNEYLSALIFIPSNQLYTVSLAIQYWINMTDEYNLMMTAAASAVIPVIILYLFTQKYFVKSVATTGVKG
jgi:multiple sugar transport system permease protein